MRAQECFTLAVSKTLTMSLIIKYEDRYGTKGDPGNTDERRGGPNYVITGSLDGSDVAAAAASAEMTPVLIRKNDPAADDILTTAAEDIRIASGASSAQSSIDVGARQTGLAPAAVDSVDLVFKVKSNSSSLLKAVTFQNHDNSATYSVPLAKNQTLRLTGLAVGDESEDANSIKIGTVVADFEADANHNAASAASVQVDEALELEILDVTVNLV